MRLAILYVATVLWMVICCESVFSASIRDTDRKIVKRDLEIIPAIFSGAVDTTLDLLDRFGKGFGMRVNSKTDAFGLHHEKHFDVGTGDAITSQGREKRSAVPCKKGRRKRFAQTYENPPNGNHLHGHQHQDREKRSAAICNNAISPVTVVF